MEKGTNYSFKINALRELTFQKVKNVSDQFVRELPEAVQYALYEDLRQRADLLQTEPSMAAYLYFYGNIHEARFKRAFSYLSSELFNQESEWIDYDCGEGISEMVYHDFLQSRNLHPLVRRFTLVNSSEICLKRAELHVRRFFPDAEIRPVCKSVNELLPEDVATDNRLPKLHLLTGTLHPEIFSSARLSKILEENKNGWNQYVCVSPFYGESSRAIARLDNFVETMNVDPSLCISENLRAARLEPDKPWTCSLRVFIKDGIERGHYVTENNVSYWIDKEGVKYSKDKHALIRFKTSSEGKYVIPDSVSMIEDSAFEGCVNLAHFVADSKYFKSQDGVLYSQDMTRLIKYPPARESARFKIPATVQVIEKYAFAGCNQLESVYIPESVVSVCEGAFAGCSQLKLVNIPEFVTRIGGNAFASCSSLTTLIFNAYHCETMGNPVHGHVNDISPDTLVFKDCGALTTIHIGSQVKVIPAYAFSRCENIYSVVLPQSVSSIGENAFSYCKRLESITLSTSVTSIGRNAFGECENLQAVFVPKGMFPHFSKMEALQRYIICIVEEGSGYIEDEGLEAGELPVYSPFAEDIEPNVMANDVEIPEPDVSYSDPIEARHETTMEAEVYVPTPKTEPEPEPERESEQKPEPELSDSDKSEESDEPAVIPPPSQPVTAEEPSVRSALSDTIGLLRKAAEQGYAKAQNNLGYLYETGKDVPQSDEEAVKWYRKAASQGHAKAQFNLANHYSKGLGVPQSDTEAAKWYLEAAKNGLHHAMNNLGFLYATGHGVPQSDEEAIKWYRKAAEQGNKNAIHNLQKRGLLA
ncbi:MAG: leucine-rich repeat protein [Tannerella sp.]|jgi:hypothetical protein|nr:leucine-rich repeat protein [Tannerella sp.]